MTDAEAFPSGTDEHSSEPSGLVGVKLLLAPETFPKVAERIGLVIAEEQHGLSGDAAREFAESLRDRLTHSLDAKRDILKALEKGSGH